jgi:hypothetical protein
MPIGQKRVSRVKSRITTAAVIGFVVPVLWGSAAFILFNARQSIWTDVFWWLVYLTCPFWILPGTAGMLLMPFLNAGMYGLIAAGTLRLHSREEK